LGITLNPETKRPFCELGLDTSKLQKTEDPELHGYVAYTNNEEGIEYYVTNDGRLYEIRYFGTLSDRTRLRCPENKTSFSVDKQRRAETCP
jgi:hypothetical protein